MSLEKRLEGKVALVTGGAEARAKIHALYTGDAEQRLRIHIDDSRAGIALLIPRAADDLKSRLPQRGRGLPDIACQMVLPVGDEDMLVQLMRISKEYQRAIIENNGKNEEK